MGNWHFCTNQFFERFKLLTANHLSLPCAAGSGREAGTVLLSEFSAVIDHVHSPKNP